MIFSETTRYLFDPLIGGPPRAFECKLAHKKQLSKTCGFIAKSKRGMALHQLLVHRFTPQSKIRFEVADDTPRQTETA